MKIIPNERRIDGDPRVAVVIPCYRVKKHIMGVLSRIGSNVEKIYVIDDCCPENSGDFVLEHNHDPRVVVIRHEKNQGVGGAVLTGYQAAIKGECEIIVKIDGDGQMDPELLPAFIGPIVDGVADYTKGNRFFDIDSLQSMPKIRKIGNAGLSFLTKLSSGYWNIFDPTNGYTAIHAEVARHLPFSKISKRYFFETDILFRLNIIKAVVMDIPMEAKYEDEESNLKIKKIFFEFSAKHLKNFIKRIFYSYYLRDMFIGSFSLPIGIVMCLFGIIYGGYNWALSYSLNEITAPGVVMLAALPFLVGVQLLLSFFNDDISATPSKPIHKMLRRSYANRLAYLNEVLSVDAVEKSYLVEK
jgi:glycosyltransferase involved in cell wall biosynthesis